MIRFRLPDGSGEAGLFNDSSLHHFLADAFDDAVDIELVFQFGNFCVEEDLVLEYSGLKQTRMFSPRQINSEV